MKAFDSRRLFGLRAGVPSRLVRGMFQSSVKNLKAIDWAG